MSIFKREFAAEVLVSAIFSNDAEACARYGISTKTLTRYRRRLNDDPELSALVHMKKSVLERAWGDDLLKAIKQAAKFIGDAAESARADDKCKKDPNLIAAMAGALKLCAEIHLTGKVLDARTANSNRSTDIIPEQVSSAEYAH